MSRQKGIRHRWVEVGGVRVGELVAGSGAPVVLLHGLAGSRRWWSQTLPVLADRYEVHVPELFALRRGGRRFRPPAVPTLAELVAEWLRRAGLGRAVLVGHSMGGHLSIHLAARHPELVRRLVLVNSTGLPPSLRPAEALRLARGLFPRAAWGAPGFLPVIGMDSVRAGLVAVSASLRSLLRDDVRPLLPHIDVPTAVIWGEFDPVVRIDVGEQLARSIPGARLHLIPGAAHNPMIDRPAIFNSLLLDVLAGRRD